MASDRDANDRFGESVAISGDYIIIGVHREDEDENGNNTLQDPGSVYIFKKDEGGTDNWGQIKKIVASNRAAYDFFGKSVAISGDYAIIGGSNVDTDANGGNLITNAGAAYILKKDLGGTDNWGELTKISASVRDADAWFGHSVSMSGDYVIVGAFGEEDGSFFSNAGAAYIFKKDEGGADNWGELTKIVSSDRAAHDWFGTGVAISDDYAVVGAYQEDEDETGTNYLNSAGSSYIFKRDEGGADNWGQVQKIVSSDRAAYGDFGYDVAISGDYILVGDYSANLDADGNNYKGAAGTAYFFKDQAALPVELTSFTAQLQADQTNLLQWQTTTEENNKGFEIERSANGESWETLDFIIGNGTTIEEQNYRYVDTQPIKGTNYYRLKQIDFDGQFEYSKVITVTLKSNISVSDFYPNPTNGLTRLDFEVSQSSDLIITVFNVMGQQLLIETHSMEKGISTLELNFSKLSKGSYFVKLQNGKEVQHQKLVID